MSTYAAVIPPEPEGVATVVDSGGYVWQKVDEIWTSRRKRQFFLGQGDARITWRVLLFDYGPVTVVPMPTVPAAVSSAGPEGDHQ